MTAPKWDVAVIDGEPVEIVNAAGVAKMCVEHPLGATVALAMLRGRMQPEHFAVVAAEVRQVLA